MKILNCRYVPPITTSRNIEVLLYSRFVVLSVIYWLDYCTDPNVRGMIDFRLEALLIFCETKAE